MNEPNKCTVATLIKNDPSDVCIWPNGFWCYISELEDEQIGTDYVVVPHDKELSSDFPDQQTYEAFKEATNG